MNNILSSQNTKILLLGGVVGIALEVFVYLLSQFFVGNFVFGLSFNPQTIYLLLSFIACLVSLTLFLVLGANNKSTLIVGGIISGIFATSSIFLLGYGTGVIVGIVLSFFFFIYSAYDASERVSSSTSFSLRTVALPIIYTLSIALFFVLGGVVFDYISRFGLSRDYVVNYIADERFTTPVFDSIFESYGNFSPREKELIIKESQKTFVSIADNLVSRANESILGPFVGVIGLLFIFQIFNIFFVYSSFVLLYVIFNILKLSGFIKISKVQKEIEQLTL